LTEERTHWKVLNYTDTEDLEAGLNENSEAGWGAWEVIWKPSNLQFTVIFCRYEASS
jgi:hypothetical protein